MKWHYASLSDYPQTTNPCLVETPDAYRIMWYSNMDKRMKRKRLTYNLKIVWDEILKPFLCLKKCTQSIRASCQ